MLLMGAIFFFLTKIRFKRDRTLRKHENYIANKFYHQKMKIFR